MTHLFDALYAAGHKPFDLAIERLIVLLRISLTVFCLVEFTAAPGPQYFDRSGLALIC